MTVESLTLPLWRGRQYHAAHLVDDDTRYVDAGYIALAENWYVHAPTVGDRCTLAGIPDPWDSALPQTWFDEHTADILQHGGYAVWTYPPGNLFGEPMFADEIERRACQTAAALLAEALELE